VHHFRGCGNSTILLFDSALFDSAPNFKEIHFKHARVIEISDTKRKKYEEGEMNFVGPYLENSLADLDQIWNWRYLAT